MDGIMDSINWLNNMPFQQLMQFPPTHNQARDEDEHEEELDDDEDEGQIFDTEEEDEPQTLEIPSTANQKPLQPFHGMNSPANTNNKIANEEKANLLRARLIAMRASTPARGTAVRESINSFTDIDSLVEQGKTAAANAEMANSSQLLSIPTQPPNNTTNSFTGIPRHSESQTSETLSRTGTQENIPNTNLANELREYQKLQELSSRMLFQGERPDDMANSVPQAGTSKHPSLVIRSPTNATLEQISSQPNLCLGSTNFTLQREPATNDADEMQSPQHSTRAIATHSTAASNRTIVNSTAGSVSHAAEPASTSASDGTHEAVRDEDTHHAENDINDWLELSGFNNVQYREKKLDMYRKYQAILTQQAELEREMQSEGGFAFRFQSAQPMEDIKPPITVKMPPPSLLEKQRALTMKQDSDEPRKQQPSNTPNAPFSASSTNERFKRPRSPEWESHRRAPPKKHPRTEGPGREGVVYDQHLSGRSPPRPSSPVRSSYNRKRGNNPRANEPLERRISLPNSNDERFVDHTRRRESFENGMERHLGDNHPYSDRAPAPRRIAGYNGPQQGTNALKLRDGGRFRQTQR